MRDTLFHFDTVRWKVATIRRTQRHIRSGLRAALLRLGEQWWVTPNTHTASVALLVAGAYYLGARVGLSITFQSSPISPIWPPNAILLVALLLVPTQTWWMCLLAVFGAHMLVELPSGIPLATATGLYFTNAGEAVLGAALVIRFTDGAPWLGTLRRAAIYLAGAVVVAPGITSFADAAVVLLTRWGDNYNNYWLNWETRCVSNILAELTIGPALLLALTRAPIWQRDAARQRWIEAAMLSVALMVAGVVAFGGQIRWPGSATTLLCAVLPVLLWAAVRFGVGGTSAALLGLTVVATWSAAHGVGLFSAYSPPENVISLQLFLICISMPMLILAAVIEERQQALQALCTSEARYRDLVESQTEMVCRYLPDSTLTFVNEAYCRMYGKPRKQLIGTKFIDRLDQQARDHHVQYTAALLMHLHTSVDEHEVVLPDGSIGWQQWIDHPIYDAKGHLVEIQAVGRDITERKRAEEALRASEARYRMVVRTLPHTAVLLFDTHLRHSFADGPGLQVLGLTPAELEGQTLWEALPHDLAAALAPHYEATRFGQVAEMDVEHAQRIYHVQVVPMAAAAGTPAVTASSAATPAPAGAGMVVLQDVTEQRHTRDELEHERTQAAVLSALSQEFRMLAEHSPDLIARFDREGSIRYVNQVGAELLDRQVEQCIGKTFAELGVSQDVSAPLAQALRDVVQVGTPRTFDIEAQAPDGQVRSLHVRFIPEFADSDGALQSVLGIATDVSALMQAEARLAEQASELEAIFEAQADVVIVYDKHRRFVRGNSAWKQFFQRSIDMQGLSTQPAFNALPLVDQVDWLKQEIRDEHGRVILGEDRPTVRALRGEIVTGSNAVDEWFQSADGRDMQISVTAAPICDRAGQITGAVLVGRDVTARRQLERQVAEQASELEAIFEAKADGVAVYDLQGRFVRANTALRHLFGFDADPEYTARPLEERAQRLLLFDEQGEMLTPEQWPHWRVLAGEILAGAGAMEGRVRTVDGRELWISTTGAPIRAPDGQITGVVLVTRDVTARRALERQVAEQAAAAERTRLAHELHDTVTQEIYSAGLLADSITRNWPEHRTEAEQALAQLPGVIRGALAGLRVLLLELRPTTLEQLPLAALLRQLGEAMSTRAKVPIAVRIQVNGGDGVNKAVEPPLPPEVKLAFYRVAQEALMNAAKYAKARAISVHLRAHGRGKFELEIADDGRGFDPRSVPAEHFGLAIMRERALAVGATLQVQSQPGQGTQIVVVWRMGRGRRQAAMLHRVETTEEATHERTAPHSGDPRR